MAKVSAPSRRTPSRKGKVRKAFWLSPKVLRKAQEYLGTTSERETVEMALDLVVFRQELIDGARNLFGLTIGAPGRE